MSELSVQRKQDLLREVSCRFCGDPDSFRQIGEIAAESREDLDYILSEIVAGYIGASTRSEIGTVLEALLAFDTQASILSKRYDEAVSNGD